MSGPERKGLRAFEVGVQVPVLASGGFAGPQRSIDLRRGLQDLRPVAGEVVCRGLAPAR